MDDQTTPWTSKLRVRLRGRMASGVIALVPIVVTIAVLRFLFGATSSVLLPLVGPAAAGWPPAARAALSFGILIAIVYALGELATNLVGRRIIGFAESVVLRVPLVKVVYSASKQVAAAFDGRKARAFKSVVFIEFPHPGMRAIGFETSTTTDEQGVEWSTVFMPTTPNPTTGFLQIVPSRDVIRTNYSVEDGIKIVMSLGVLAPEFGVAVRS